MVPETKTNRQYMAKKGVFKGGVSNFFMKSSSDTVKPRLKIFQKIRKNFFGVIFFRVIDRFSTFINMWRIVIIWKVLEHKMRLFR